MDLLGAIILLVALASAGAALLSLGGRFSDRLDVLTHFTPLYLAGGVLAVAGGWRDGPALLAGTVAILISALIMGPEYLAAAKRPGATVSGRSLKLVQFNLWVRNADPEGTARWIEREDADIVVVQEAAGAGAAVILAVADRYPFRSASFAGSDGSTVVLSKTKPRVSGDPSGGVGKRFAGAWATFGRGEAGFTVVAAHFTHPIPPGPQQAQSRRLSEFLKAFDRSNLIVAGDFNATPWSFALRRQDARFGLARLTRALFTWPTTRFRRWGLRSPVPFLALDHVYAGSAWRAASVTLGPRLGSDHLPVVVVLERVA